MLNLYLCPAITLPPIFQFAVKPDRADLAAVSVDLRVAVAPETAVIVPVTGDVNLYQELLW